MRGSVKRLMFSLLVNLWVGNGLLGSFDFFVLMKINKVIVLIRFNNLDSLEDRVLVEMNRLDVMLVIESMV